jgi:DnaK suppressor protein
MARRDALLRLHKTLMSRRSELLKRLGVEFHDLGQTGVTTASGDAADAAFDTHSEEIASQLAELEAKELNQIQRAIIRLRQGRYGECEICGTKIPVARLNALPYSTMCINCQRDMETDANWEDTRGHGDWDRVADTERHSEERREVDLSDIEVDLSK